MSEIPASADWLIRSLASITEAELGDEYRGLVAALIRLETLHGFSTSASVSLPAPGRPEAVTAWIKGGRKVSQTYGRRVPDVVAYKKTWWTWWRTLQPKRTHLQTSWDCLLIPGQNGLVVVVASIYLWGCGVLQIAGRKKEERASWIEGVKDCRLVIECLLEEIKLRDTNGGGGVSEAQGGGGGEDDDEMYVNP